MVQSLHLVARTGSRIGPWSERNIDSWALCKLSSKCIPKEYIHVCRATKRGQEGQFASGSKEPHN